LVVGSRTYRGAFICDKGAVFKHRAAHEEVYSRIVHFCILVHETAVFERNPRANQFETAALRKIDVFYITVCGIFKQKSE